jgi:hypothetical protein
MKILTFNKFLNEELNVNNLITYNYFIEDEINYLKRYGFDINNNIAIGEENDVIIKIEKDIEINNNRRKPIYSWKFIYNDNEFDEGYEYILDNVILQISKSLEKNINLIKSYKSKEKSYNELPKWKKVLRTKPKIKDDDELPDYMYW